jgi:membrane protein required for colicin V production
VDVSSFNTLDIIIIVLVAVPGVRGLYRGLLEEATALAAVIAGVIFANQYYYDVAPMIEKVFHDPKLVGILSYALVFSCVVLVVTVFGKVLRKVLSVTFAGWLDHLAGCLLGVGVGLVLSCLAYMVINHFSPQADMLRASQLTPYLEQIVQWGQTMLPQLLKSGFDWQPHLPAL